MFCYFVLLPLSMPSLVCLSVCFLVGGYSVVFFVRYLVLFQIVCYCVVWLSVMLCCYLSVCVSYYVVVLFHLIAVILFPLSVRFLSLLSYSVLLCLFTLSACLSVVFSI